MADGIVGAISLGSQVTKELAAYYSAFKSHERDIMGVTNRIELVSNVFERLQATIQNLTLIPVESSAELTTLLAACKDCLDELEGYRDKCRKKKHAPESLKDRAGRTVKRSVYPFRRSTLEGLQNTLDGLAGMLQLMMHITHV
jgi:conjugal transfer/entry exclusion protein